MSLVVSENRELWFLSEKGPLKWIMIFRLILSGEIPNGREQEMGKTASMLFFVLINAVNLCHEFRASASLTLRLKWRCAARISWAIGNILCPRDQGTGKQWFIHAVLYCILRNYQHELLNPWISLVNHSLRGQCCCVVRSCENQKRIHQKNSAASGIHS